jgi:hypothetical protein
MVLPAEMPVGLFSYWIAPLFLCHPVEADSLVFQPLDSLGRLFGLKSGANALQLLFWLGVCHLMLAPEVASFAVSENVRLCHVPKYFGGLGCHQLLHFHVNLWLEKVIPAFPRF